MSQDSLPVSNLRPIASLYRRYVLAVQDAVDALTLGVAAGRAGVRSQDLSDMLNGVKGRRLPIEVAAPIADAVSGDLQTAIHNAIKEMFGMVQPAADPEFIRRLEDGYSRFGEVGRIELAKIRREAHR
jgi:hypothetical protein